MQCLERREDFSSGPGLFAPYVVSDGNLITSRRYRDAELFGKRFANELEHRIKLQNVISILILVS